MRNFTNVTFHSTVSVWSSQYRWDGGMYIARNDEKLVKNYSLKIWREACGRLKSNNSEIYIKEIGSVVEDWIQQAHDNPVAGVLWRQSWNFGFLEGEGIQLHSGCRLNFSALKKTA